MPALLARRRAQFRARAPRARDKARSQMDSGALPRVRALVAHLGSLPSIAVASSTASAPVDSGAADVEREIALEDSALQRRVTGGAVVGYRPHPLSPWAWDNELPAECIRWSRGETDTGFPGVT